MVNGRRADFGLGWAGKTAEHLGRVNLNLGRVNQDLSGLPASATILGARCV